MTFEQASQSETELQKTPETEREKHETDLKKQID